MNTRLGFVALVSCALSAAACSQYIRTPEEAQNTFSNVVAQHRGEIRACYEKRVHDKGQKPVKAFSDVQVTLSDEVQLEVTEKPAAVQNVDAKRDDALGECAATVMNGTKTPYPKPVDVRAPSYAKWHFVYDPNEASETRVAVD